MEDLYSCQNDLLWLIILLIRCLKSDPNLASTISIYLSLRLRFATSSFEDFPIVFLEIPPFTPLHSFLFNVLVQEWPWEGGGYKETLNVAANDYYEVA